MKNSYMKKMQNCPAMKQATLIVLYSVLGFSTYITGSIILSYLTMNHVPGLGPGGMSQPQPNLQLLLFQCELFIFTRKQIRNEEIRTSPRKGEEWDEETKKQEGWKK